jgi:hypothetical protein
MDSLFNVYFNGQILEGQDLGDVRKRIASLFNANQATLDKLFSGKTQLIKRDCDQATALKFKQAIGAAGGVAIIKQANQGSAAPSPAPAAKTTTKTMSAAERIAALAGAPDQGSYAPANAPAAGSTQAGPDDGKADAFQLEPSGADVLRAEERSQPVEARIDTSALSIDGPVERLSAAPETAPPAPDTSHLSMGQAGETIPTLPTTAVPLTPNTDALGLAPSDSDLSDCAPAAAEPLVLDLSAIEIAPPGAEVLEEQFRRKHDEPAPSTDHLSLKD